VNMDPVQTLSKRHLVRLFCLGVLSLLAGGRVYGQGGGGGGNTLPPGEGRDLVAVACGQCHGLRTITLLRDGPAGWKKTVDEMTLRGAPIEQQETETIVQYLSNNFGPSAGPMQSGLTVPNLPAGPGSALVQSHCTLCHDLGRVTGVQRTKDEWDGTVKNMMSRISNMATPAEMQMMATYLTSQFGKKAN